MDVEVADLVFLNNDLQEVKGNQVEFGGWHPVIAQVIACAEIYYNCFFYK